MSTSLPARPDLDQLRRQAKDLLRAAWAGDPSALRRMRAHLDLRPGSPLILSAVQLVVAREYGFGSWPALVAEVRGRTADLVDRLTGLVTGSVQGHFDPPDRWRAWDERARRLVAETPGVAGYDIRLAAVLGDPAAARQLIARDPGLAVRPDDRAGWPPLLFVCSSRWHRIDPTRADGLVAVARLLLDAGADPNTAVGRSPQAGHCSPLYAAAGLANHPALARLLLDRGADPDTPSALYHTAFHRDHACLKLLLERGARAEGLAALGAAISVADTAAVRLLLAAGVEPGPPIPADAFAEVGEDEPPIPAVRAAIEYGGTVEMIETLLAHGADPAGTTSGAPSTYRLAERRGDPAIAEILRRHGAVDDTSVVDRFLGACMRADRATVDGLLDHQPDLVSGLSAPDLGLIVDAAEHHGLRPVALMLDLGFPPDTRRGADGATALHAAAYTGRADVVRLLIESGADVDARDGRFDSTALCWATVGSGERPRSHPHGDWVATVQALLEAGASFDGAWVPGKPPSDEVAALLLAYGIGPATPWT